MAEIKAFIGHSFAEDDDLLVRKFLDYFNVISEMQPGFTWDHAKAAETKDLAEKVLAKLQGKNLFIGICTSKERVVDPSALKRGSLFPKRLVGESSSFKAKTSDWIIQEIGLAVGREMELMLLLEEGLRPPGGLQGNREYISFDRSAPDKSFQQILETILSLNPKSVGSSAETVEPSVGTEEKEKERKGEDWLKPNDKWTRHEFEFALMHMIASDNEGGVQKINDAYLASKEAQGPQFCESWEAAKEYFRIALSKGGSLAKLQELAKKYPENSEVLKHLAKVYSRYADDKKATELYEVAANKAGDDNTKFERYADAVLASINTDQKEKTKIIITKMKALAQKIEDGEVFLIETLRKVAEKDGDMDMFFGLSERLLQIRPDDTDARFSLAYRYSQEGQDDASLFHYLKIQVQDREPGTWNNLGVEYDHFSLVGKAVDAYRKATKAGETLAASNLAYKLLNAGFLQEANGICNKALVDNDCHKNVNQAISRIKEIPEEEDNKEKEVIDKALPMSEYYREYGNAMLQENAPDYEGNWKGPDCELKIVINGNHFVAEGQYDQPALGVGSLGNALMGKPVSRGPMKMIHCRVKYEGIVSGRSIKCVLTRETEGGPAPLPSLLGGEGKDMIALMILSEPLQEITVWETKGTRGGKAYKLRALASV